MSNNGIDYDLEACLDHNPQPGFDITDVESVLAVWQGENDEDDWRWILQLKDGRVAGLQGWCDYTGWDCQSGAGSHVFDSLSLVMTFFEDGHPDNGYRNTSEVRESLLNQLSEGKIQTWRERAADDMGLNDIQIVDGPDDIANQ